MKKFLLCMTLAGLMLPVIAQEKLSAKKVHASEMRSDLGVTNAAMLPMNTTGTIVGAYVIAGKSESYDRQTQGNVYPMTQMHDDGKFIGAVWTNEDNPPFPGSSTATRGVAYTFSKDRGETWASVDLRVGGIPLYWPSYAQWGVNGEAILARSADTYMHGDMQILNGLVLLTRENRGEGDWTLRIIPYPEETPPGTSDQFVMAWSRMTTSGDNHKYIQIMTHVRGKEGVLYHGYYAPLFYYRTQDGGATWDVSAKLVPDEVAGESWDAYPDGGTFTDDVTIAANGDVIACTAIALGQHCHVLKSTDNGDTWTTTKFFNAPCRWYADLADPETYTDSCFTPSQGTVAVDNNGKVHIAFGMRGVKNTEQAGYLSLYRGFITAFLSYWNEDMDPLDGAIDFPLEPIEDIMFEQFVDYDSSEYSAEGGRLYIISTTPEWPIIGFFTPTTDPRFFTAPSPDDFDWIQESYGRAGTFSFPQMAFDKDNKLHLSYLGVLDGGDQDGRWLRHPYYTTRSEDDTWTETEYLVNSIDLIDWEFAYLNCAGINDKYEMPLMMQVDPYAGVYQPYPGHDTGEDHSAVTNYFYVTYVKNVAINEVERTSLTMNVIPNPASGQATVNFEGKGNVTVYNMLGQTVYHVENIENTKIIPLQNMTSGVYFVTVRSGNATATQKLIVQ